MSRIVGIDLGTTNSLVAIVDAGIPLVLADLSGSRLTPSVVHYPRTGLPPTVGAAANRLRAVEPDRTVYSIKRFIGRRGAEVKQEETEVSYRIDVSGDITVLVDDKKLKPEEISAEVLRKLKADAEQSLGEEISRAVITVPAYFNDGQRQATKRAGELAGLTVERIINEPTAAALAYGLDRLGEHSRIAVYDLGGGTFDLSILELKDGVFQVLATHGNTRLGGDDLDARVLSYLGEEIVRQGGPDYRREPLLTARLREAAEQAKIQLSFMDEVDVTLPFLTSAFSFQHTLTRTKLETLTRDLIMQTKAHCMRALSDAKLESRELHQVVLVGGQTRMPLVRELVADFFGCVDFESVTGSIRVGTEYHQPAGPLLNTSQNPDEAVALGAAIQAAILSGGFQNVLLLDVTPLSLGLETFGGLMNVIVPRNSTIPIKAGEAFTTAVDYQTSMLIHVLQGERERAKDNWTLGRFTIPFERAPRSVARVGVQFEIDANGILHVLARDLRSGNEMVVELKSAVDVSDEKVQQMVEESVDHAFEDLRLRQWVEARMKAAQTMEVTDKAFGTSAEELAPADQEAIREALAEVRAALGTEQAETGTGDLNRLRSAHSKLDQATQPLATLLMDKAMDELLRKRGLA